MIEWIGALPAAASSASRIGRARPGLMPTSTTTCPSDVRIRMVLARSYPIATKMSSVCTGRMVGGVVLSVMATCRALQHHRHCHGPRDSLTSHLLHTRRADVVLAVRAKAVGGQHVPPQVQPPLVGHDDVPDGAAHQRRDRHERQDQRRHRPAAAPVCLCACACGGRLDHQTFRRNARATVVYTQWGRTDPAAAEEAAEARRLPGVLLLSAAAAPSWSSAPSRGCCRRVTAIPPPACLSCAEKKERVGSDRDQHSRLETEEQPTGTLRH
jgi:hypothetical protein